MNKRTPQSGHGLLEVLISLSLLALGVLSFSKLQLLGIDDSRSAANRHLAQNQLTNMAEILHLTKANVEALIREWQQDTKRLLPQGQGEIESQGGAFLIRVRWEGASLTPAQFKSCSKINLPLGRCLEMRIIP